MQVAEALDAAHAAGVVHRDLKPENVMAASSGYAKVLDFGLAKLRPDSCPTARPTHGATGRPRATPGMLLGTVGYMSPEQVDGRTVDHRSDVFSFGCVLYEAVTGAARVCRIVHDRHAAPDRARRPIGGCQRPSAMRRPSSAASSASVWRKIPPSGISR